MAFRHGITAAAMALTLTLAGPGSDGPSELLALIATVLLAKTGIVSIDSLGGKRGMVLLGIFIVAAFLTPPDPVSQTMMAVPMYLLYEGGILLARLLVRRAPPQEGEDEGGDASSA